MIKIIHKIVLGVAILLLIGYTLFRQYIEMSQNISLVIAGVCMLLSCTLLILTCKRYK